jgi:hypothetical protein
MTDRNERCPGSADETVQDIGEATRRKFSAEEKIRIVLQSLHGEETIAEPTGHRLEAARTRVRRQDVGVLHTTTASLVVVEAARRVFMMATRFFNSSSTFSLWASNALRPAATFLAETEGVARAATASSRRAVACRAFNCSAAIKAKDMSKTE